MAKFDWTDLFHITQLWELFKYIHIPYTNSEYEFSLHKLFQITPIWDLFNYRHIPYTGYDDFWLDRPVPYCPDMKF